MKTKKFNEFLPTTQQNLNESVIATLAILGSGVVSVFALLQFFSALKYDAHRYDFKDADLRYNDLLAWWSPKDFVKAWKLVKRDKKVLKIVNRLKDDPEVKEFLENPKQAGWQKMLSKKLDASEMDVIKNIYKRHFHEDGPKMNSWESNNIVNNRAKSINEFLNEANNMRTLKGFLKELRKEYGPTPSPQSLADFIYNNYEEVTGEKLEDSDPASNDHIADIIAYFKMDGEDFAIAWEDRTNESVNEKVKLIMRNILSKMIPAGFGPTTSPKMREEIRNAIQGAIEPILKKYDYVVESELYEKNFQVIIGDEVIEYTLRENLAGNGIIALPNNSKELDKEIESGASKTAIGKDIEKSINSRLKRARQAVTVEIDYRYEGAGYGFKLNVDGLLQKLNK
jgi:hypothetical protein